MLISSIGIIRERTMFDANYNKIHLPRIKENSREQLFPEFYCYICIY